MANRPTCEQIFAQNKIIPVVILDDMDKAVPVAQALFDGGISAMEVTLRTPNALKIIEKLRTQVPQMLTGAGTVLNVEQYHSAVKHGAQFIVSPGLTPTLAQIASNYTIPFLPGAITPSEIMQALLMGFNYLKFFPSVPYNGYQVLKTLASPFAGVKFCPTGGITLDNVQQYLSLPNVAGVGCSFLVRDDLVANNDFAEITALAKQTIAMATGK